MVKIMSGWLVMWMALLCGCQSTSKYIIQGNFAGYSGKVFLLSPNMADKLDTLGRVEVRNGNFQLAGMVEKPRFVWLEVENRKLKIPMFLENTSYSVLVDMKEQPATWRVTGGELQQVRERFKREVEDMIREKRDSLEGEYQKCAEEKNLFGKFHVRALLEGLDSLYEKKEDEFIRENDNLVSASLIYVRLSALNKNKMLRGKYESVSLYSVKAKVKIVDFWASWCGPCRAENPHVKELYEKYHDKGLEVISVSLDDKKDKWQKAIEQDGLPWIHVSDLQAWGNPLVKMLGIQGIPYLIVLDKDNRIVGTRLRGEQLDRCVMEAIR